MPLQTRDRRALLAMGVVLALVVGYLYVADPVIQSQRNVQAGIVKQSEQLRTFQQVVRRRKELELIRHSIAASMEKLDERVYVGDKPPLTAAELQRALKELARQAGVRIEREKILDPVAAGSFQRIPIEINVRSSVKNLSHLMYLIESYPKFLVISELKIEVTNRRNPSNVKARLVVGALLRERRVKSTPSRS